MMLLTVLICFAGLWSVTVAITRNTGFSVYLKTRTVVQADGVVVYPYVATNDFNAYNTTTGIFTAPMTGLFVFHFYGIAEIGEGFWICLYRNTQCIYRAHGGASNVWEMGGNAIALRVQLSQRIYIKCWRTAYLYSTPTEIYSTFSGYFVGR